MKKHVTSLKSLVFLMGVVLSIGAFGETNYSVNVGGLLKVDSRATNTVVAVPWMCFNTNGQMKIDIGTLVKQRNFVPGDTVMTVAADGSRVYEAWALGDDGWTWERVQTIRRETARQSYETPIEATNRWCGRGIGLWVSRCGVGADLTKPFYLGGQYESNAITNEIVAGTMTKPAWTLLSNPLEEAVDLNEDIAWNSNPSTDDLLSLVTSGGTLQTYTWRDSDRKWGYSEYRPIKEGSTFKKQVRVTDDCVVKPGYAFWYIRRGGAAFEIEWKKK